MIYVNIRGRLGNQLFQYACARKIQNQTGQKICLNTYNLNNGVSDFEFSLKDYKLNENVIIEENKPLPWFASNNNIFIKVIRKTFRKKNIKYYKAFWYIYLFR